MRSISSTHLEAHIFDMSFDGARRDPDLVRYFLGGVSVGDQFQDLKLAVREFRLNPVFVPRHLYSP